MRQTWFSLLIFPIACSPLLANKGTDPFILTNGEHSSFDSEVDALKNELSHLKQLLGSVNEKVNEAARTAHLQTISGEIFDSLQNQLNDLHKKFASLLEDRAEPQFSNNHITELHTSLENLENKVANLSSHLQKKDLLLADAMQQDPSKPLANRSRDRIFDSRSPVDRNDWYAYGEFLYWKADEQGLDFAIKDVPLVPTICGGVPCPFGSGTTQIGNIAQGRYKWQPGLRVGLGAGITPDHWQLEGQYTYIAPSGSVSVKNTRDPFIDLVPSIQSTIAPQFSQLGLDKAKNHVALSFNLADFFLAKRLQISKQILLRLSFGGTGVWIQQKTGINYFSLASGGNYFPHPGGIFDKWRMKWAFQGGGLMAKLETDWFMGCGLSLTGRVKGALLYGNYKNRLSLLLYNPADSPEPIFTVGNVRLHEQRLIPTLQLALGPSWGMNFSQFDLLIFGLYELNVWYNLQQFLFSGNSQVVYDGRVSHYTQGALGLQGLTAGIQINY